MNKKLLLLIYLTISYATVLTAQPTVLGTELINGTYTTNNLTQRGAVRYVRLQATSAAVSGARKWEFATGTAASPSYTTNWRPYIASQTLSGFNTKIDPATAPASARYNTSSGGSSGLLPAITASNYYTINVQQNSAANNFMSILETSYNPTSISSVSQSPTSSSVYPGAAVTVSTVMAATLNSGEAVYLRYSTDGFSTSTVAQMIFASGTTYTANIPAQAAATTVQYYVFTSNVTSATVTGNPTDADYYTLNLQTSTGSNNTGANFSYTVNSAQSAQTGNWSSTSTWLGGNVPPSGSPVIINHNVTLDQAATVSSLTINSTKIFDNGSQTLNISSGGSLTNNGTFTASTGTVSFAGAGTVSGTIAFNNLTIAGGVTLSTASTVNGNLQINAGGSISSNAPIYGSSSTLTYNTGGTYNISNEWTSGNSNTVAAGTGVPANVTITNSTNVIIQGANGRGLPGDLTVNNGSTLTLGSSSGGDIYLGGNYTQNGTLTNNGRAFFFTKASGTQTLSGSGTLQIPYLVFGTNGSRTVQLSGVDLNCAATGGGNTISFNSASDIIDLNGRSITLGTTGQTCNINGSGFFSGNTASSFSIQGTTSTGTIQFSGNTNVNNFTCNLTGGGTTLGSDLIVNGTMTLTAGTVSIAGRSLTFQAANTPITRTSGTITTSSGSSVTFSGSGNAASIPDGTFSAAPTLLNFTINRTNSLTLGNQVITILASTGNLNLTAGNLINGTSLTLGAGATISRTAGTLNSAPTFGATVNLSYLQNGSQTTVGNEWPSTATVLNNLTINTTNGILLNASKQINGTLNLIAGTLTVGTNTLTLSGTVPTRTSGNIDASNTGATVAFTNATAFTLPASLFTGNINNLTINGGGIGLGSSTTVAGTLAATAGTLTVGANTLTLSGTVPTRTSGNIDASNTSATVAFTNATTFTLPASLFTGNINNLTINGGGITLPATSPITVTTSLVLTAGTLADGGNTITLAGNITGTGTHTGSGKISMTTSGATISGATLQNLELNNAGGFSLSGSPTIKGALTLTSGKLAIGSNTLSLNGTFSGSASNSLTGSSTSNIGFGGSSAVGTLYFDQTTDGTTNTLNNVTLNNSYTTGSAVILGNTLKLIGTLTPTKGQLATGGNLTLVSTNEYNSGSIGDASANTNFASTYITGNVTTQRYTRAQRGYRTLSHPFSTAQPLSILTNTIRITGLTTGASGTYAVSTGNPSAFLYNPTAAAGSNAVLTRLTDGTSALWPVAQGLYIFVRGSGTEGSVGAGISNYGSGISPVRFATAGAVNQGAVSYTLGYSAGMDNFNLVGNPYPSAINLKNVTGLANGTIYVYNPILNIGTSNIYSIAGGFNSYSYTNGTTDIIVPAMGAFYVKATSASTLTFNEVNKVSATVPTYTVFGTSKQPSFMLQVTTAQGGVDDLKFGFNNTSTAASGDTYDALKLANSLFDLYSIASDSNKLTIDYRDINALENSTIPLGIKTNVATTYTMSLAAIKDLPNTQLVLRDKLLKTETILSNVGDSYSFNITADTATKGENRFEIGLLGTTVLPVQIADITAQLQANKTVAVNWTSATEINLANYHVQRSKDGTSFNTVGTVPAKGAGAYNYSDDLSTVGTLPSTIYYRLEAVDKNGSKTYSKVVAVLLGSSQAKAAISIYPNPVQSTLYAQVTVSKAGAAQLRVIDAQGKAIITQKTQLAQGTTSLSIPAMQLTNGSYVLEIESADGKQQQRFVKE